MGNRTQLDAMGKRILSAVRNELYLHMHFLGPALGSLRFEMDLWTKTVGTDAVSIRFNPDYLFRTYLEHPYLLDRAYMHILMHCLFRHMFSADEHPDAELWDLASDIAAESVVDSMDDPVIRVVQSDFREAWYRKLKEEIHVLTAEKIYRYFADRKRDYVMEAKLAAEFARDDHSFWARMQKEGKNDAARDPSAPPAPSPQGGGPDSGEDRKDEQRPEQDRRKDPEAAPLIGGRILKDVDESWKKNVKRVEAELLTGGKHASDDAGDLERLLRFETRERKSYKEFLRQFAVIREEPRIDLDSFDYGFYNYGMQMYGNMPLIEENEYRESKKIEDLAIVIDTSASCQDVLVQQFLNETATILAGQESFFRKVNIHIIECDDAVREDVVIRDTEAMKKYAGGFRVKGGGGTDFRPAFAYVDKLMRTGKIGNLKGLLYFTDGFGIFPEKPTPYKTAFVFWKEEELNDREVPGWAARLYLDAEGRA